MKTPQVAAIARLSRRDYDRLVGWRYGLLRALPSYADFLRRAVCEEEGVSELEGIEG